MNLSEMFVQVAALVAQERALAGDEPVPTIDNRRNRHRHGINARALPFKAGTDLFGIL